MVKEQVCFPTYFITFWIPNISSEICKYLIPHHISYLNNRMDGKERAGLSLCLLLRGNSSPGVVWKLAAKMSMEKHIPWELY